MAGSKGQEGGNEDEDTRERARGESNAEDG